MTPNQIAESYDKLASYWNGDQFNQANGIAQHVRAFQFIRNRRNAIDIGCGSSGRIIELMISEGFQVEALDISPEMIRMAKQRHGDVVFYLANICTWNFPKKYDFISAWDSIWHAPLANQEAILKKLCDGLNPSGVLIFASGGVDAPTEVTNPFLGEPLYHAALGIPKLLEIVTQDGCVCRHLEYDQFPEPHLYLIIQKSGQDDFQAIGITGDPLSDAHNSGAVT